MSVDQFSVPCVCTVGIFCVQNVTMYLSFDNWLKTLLLFDAWTSAQNVDICAPHTTLTRSVNSLIDFYSHFKYLSLKRFLNRWISLACHLKSRTGSSPDGWDWLSRADISPASARTGLLGFCAQQTCAACTQNMHMHEWPCPQCHISLFRLSW